MKLFIPLKDSDHSSFMKAKVEDFGLGFLEPDEIL